MKYFFFQFNNNVGIQPRRGTIIVEVTVPIGTLPTLAPPTRIIGREVAVVQPVEDLIINNIVTAAVVPAVVEADLITTVIVVTHLIGDMISKIMAIVVVSVKVTAEVVIEELKKL